MGAFTIEAEVREGGINVLVNESSPEIAIPIQFPRQILFGACSEGTLRFKRPLPAKIYREGESCIVSSGEIGQFGYGADIGEALDDFGKTVSEMYLYLATERDAGRLTPSLEAQFGLLNEFLEPRGATIKTA